MSIDPYTVVVADSGSFRLGSEPSRSHWLSNVGRGPATVNTIASFRIYADNLENALVVTAAYPVTGLRAEQVGFGH